MHPSVSLQDSRAARANQTFDTNLTANRQPSDKPRSIRRTTNNGTLGAIAGVSPVRCCVAGVGFLQVEPQSGMTEWKPAAAGSMEAGCGSMVLFYLLHENLARRAKFSCRRMASSARPEAYRAIHSGEHGLEPTV